MLRVRNSLSILLRRASPSAMRRMLGESRGAISVEFAMLLPFLAAAFISSLEVANLIWTRTSVGDAATAAADLTTRYVAVDDTTMRSVFLASERMISPEVRTVDGLQMTVSSVLACECPSGSGTYCFTVLWSHGFKDGGMVSGRAQGARVTEIPQEMGPPAGGTLIFAEADYNYTLPYGFVLNDRIQAMESQTYFRPRMSRAVAHTGTFAANAAPSCP